MAIPTIKATYALDVDTVRALEATARRLSISKSEALRRAIRAASATHSAGEQRDSLVALDELQKSLNLSAGEASRWRRAVRSERRAYRASRGARRG